MGGGGIWQASDSSLTKELHDVNVGLGCPIPWSTLAAGDEQLYQARGKSTEEIVHSQLKEKIFYFMD